MKAIFSLLLIALSISLNGYSVRPVPPHTRTGDMNLRARIPLKSVNEVIICIITAV